MTAPGRRGSAASTPTILYDIHADADVTKLSRKLLEESPTSINRGRGLKAGCKCPKRSLKPKHIQPNLPADLSPAGSDRDDAAEETVNNEVDGTVLSRLATPVRHNRGTPSGSRREQKEHNLPHSNSDLHTRFGRKYTKVHQPAKRGRNKTVKEKSPEISESLPDTAHHPARPLTRGHQAQQNAMSDRAESITPRRIQTSVPSLRKPVVRPKIRTPHSETDSEFEGSDTDVWRYNFYPRRRSASIARNSASKADSSFQATADAVITRSPDQMEFLAGTEELHSEADSLDSETPHAKRHKVSGTATHDRSIDNDEHDFLSFTISCIPNPASLDASNSPVSEPVALNVVNDVLPGHVQTAPVAPMVPNMSSASVTISAIGAQDEDNTNSCKAVPVVQRVPDSVPLRPRDPRSFSKIVQQMRSSFIAKRAASEPKAARWVTDPSNPHGPPIREKSRIRNGRVYREENGPNMPSAWRVCDLNGDKRICTVEDIPNVVAKAYCSPKYTNKMQMISTLVQDYNGIRKEDIRWCLAGVSTKRSSTKKNSVAPQPDENEAPLPLVSTQGDIGGCLENDQLSSTCLSPSRSQGEGSSNVIDSSTALQTVSSRLPASETAEAATQTSDSGSEQVQSPLINPVDGSLMEIMRAYTAGLYGELLERDKNLETLQDVAHQKRAEQERSVRMLENDIEEIARSSAILRNRLAPDRRQSMGQIIDEDKAEKEKELGSLNAEQVKLIENLSMWCRERTRIREERDAFVSNAKARREDVVKLLAFIDGLSDP